MVIQKYRWFFISTAALIYACWLGFAPQAHAAEQSITITPTSASLQIQPGGHLTGSLQVLNQGRSSYPFRVYATSYHVKGEEYTPEFTPLPGTADISGWFSFSSEHPFIDPGQAVTVNYTVNVPPNTPAGGYYAVGFVATQLPPLPDSLVINQTVGEIFYIEVGGDLAPRGEVTTWKADFWQTNPLTVLLRVQNGGSSHYFAAMNIKVKDIFGRTKYTFEDEKAVLPQTIRKINILWDKAPPLGLFKIGGTVEFEGQSHTLPDKYVLVMSPTLRRNLALILALFVLLSVLRFLLGNTLKYHRAKKVKK